MQIRVSVYAMDPELRSWLVDELQLMTWPTGIDLQAVLELEAIAPGRDLVIVGLDGLRPEQLSALGAPTIAIGTALSGVSFDRVLPANVTSRQLRQAIRELLFAGRPQSGVAEPTV